MAELFLEGIEIAQKKGVKYTLFSGDEKNILAWAVGLNLTNFDCLSQKFMEYYSSAENSGIQSPNCLSGVEYASDLLVELFHQDSGLFVSMRYNGRVLNICDKPGKPESGIQECEIENFKNWLRQKFMVVHFAKFCGIDEVTAPDTVALQQTLKMYSYLKSALLIACVVMIPFIGLVWFCMGDKAKSERSDVVQEIMDFNPHSQNSRSQNGSGQKPLPSQPDDIIAPPLEVPEFEIETQNSFEDGGSFRFDQDDLKKKQKIEHGDPMMTETDRREINDSVNQHSYIDEDHIQEKQGRRDDKKFSLGKKHKNQIGDEI